MQSFLLTVFVLALSTAGSAGHDGVQKAADDALDGLDPVLLVGGKEVPGKSAFSVTRGDFVYLFSTADTKATFESDPARYEIQLGGLCARMGKTTGGNPSDFMVHEGKIYIFGSDECHRKFKAEPAKYLATPAAPLPASLAAATQGRQLIERAVAALGGAAGLDALTSYVESYSQVQARPQGDAKVTVTTMWRFPDRARQERIMVLEGKSMSSATVLSPEGMWYVGGQDHVYPMRAAGRPSLEQDFGRHPVALLRARRTPGFRAVALGSGSVDGLSVETVRVISGSTDVTLAIGASGRIHSATFRDRNAEGEYGTFSIVYSDFRPVENLQLPFNARASFDGQPLPSLSVTLDAITLNPPLDASLFAPKAQGER